LSVQKPIERATQRNDAAIEQWRNEKWPALEALVDPFEPPMPAEITADQALKLAESLARSQPNRMKIAGTILKEKLRELI
jgi:hypothetical protein